MSNDVPDPIEDAQRRDEQAIRLMLATFDLIDKTLTNHNPLDQPNKSSKTGDHGDKDASHDDD